MPADKSRPLYVYRLIVEYPEKDAPPPLWEDQNADEPHVVFSWPRARNYLSFSGAKKRADLLRRYGCVVGINRSEAVEWVEP